MSTKTYDELTAIPVPLSAAFLRDNVIQVELSTRDHVRNEKRTISKSISLDTNTHSPTVEIIGVISAVYSPSGKLKAILREAGADKDKKRFIEIWQNDLLLACKDVTDKHGIFFADDFFSSLSFAPSEESVIYAAEKKKVTEKNSVEKFVYQQPFGEGLIGKSNPVLFLFEWESDTLLTLQHDSPVWFGQARFAPSRDDKIFATGYETAADEKLLGLNYCFNRPTGIWELTFKRESEKETVDLQVRKLTDSHLSCRSPRIISSNGKHTLLWLSQPTEGAHQATAALHSCDITTGSVDPSQTRTLVDTVWEPAKGEFPGLYLAQLPRFPHVNWGKGDYIVTQTIWGSRETVVLISLQDGTVKDLTPATGETMLSWPGVLAAEGNRLVAVRSSFTAPFELVFGEFDTTGSVSWKVVHKSVVSEDLQAKLDSLTVKILPIPGRFPTEIILVQHKSALQDQKILPCITIPHGGPHTAWTVSFGFTAPIIYLALEGYTISLPNYTGSLGQGEKYVRALIGQCGTLDVGDCIESVRHLVKIGIANEGPGRQLLSGGSHGGFVLGHLIGQYPNFFTAAIFRNPVISAGEISTTDIPDWYFFEFGLDYPLSSLPLGYTGLSSVLKKAAVPPRIITPEIYSKLYNASPISHVHKVDAAVLLLIGDSDKRVAPTNGIGYYHALKALRKDSPDDVEMFMFSGEGHGLDGLEASKVVWQKTVEWFKSRAVWL